jgi:hypothetical protein
VSALDVAVVGLGASGSRCARQFASLPDLGSLRIHDRDPSRAAAVAASLGPVAHASESVEAALDGATVVVVATAGDHRGVAWSALDRDVHVVSMADEIGTVRGLLALDAEARERRRSVVCGAGFGPGLTDVLVAHAADLFDTVDEIHVARSGTGGPACARAHHHMLGATGLDWREGAWVPRRGGAGRELCWFPDPVGGQDCYGAALPDPMLLVPAFPHVRRVTARLAATRRDRLTARLPMLRPPHPEGMVGAVRVEVRGRRGILHETAVYGALDRPSVAAGAVAMVAAVFAAHGDMTRSGAGGLAELVASPVAFLAELAQRGVRAAVFEGAAV